MGIFGERYARGATRERPFPYLQTGCRSSEAEYSGSGPRQGNRCGRRSKSPLEINGAFSSRTYDKTLDTSGICDNSRPHLPSLAKRVKAVAPKPAGRRRAGCCELRLGKPKYEGRRRPGCRERQLGEPALGALAL